MRKRDYRDYLTDIVDSIGDIKDFISGLGFERFKKDKKTVNAVVRSIEIIGEATRKIPKTLKDRYPGIPWKKMAGMRDKLIHEYFGIDIEILWKVAKEDVPALNSAIRNMLRNIKDY